ncbi:MAG: methylmalonyl-CoA epimerase [Chloroflexaceae bacterium]|nr:methylmalonyl-CoA epimerase [Chloroflexaceae bacterium]
MFTHVDHIGLLVKDLDESVKFYTSAFDLSEWEIIPMPERHMMVAAARLGDTLVELICPTSDDAAIAKQLKEKGPGMHHIAYRVDDIRASLKELQDRGVRLIDKEPRPGIHNTLIAFTHPKNGDQGVLIELVQHQDAH